jgi:hypothetical protein
MPSLPGSEEILKALLTGVATTIVSRLSGIFEALSDPNSPRRILDEAKETLANMDAAGKVMVQLNQLPQSPHRDAMQAKLDALVQSMEKSQQRCSDELLEKRSKILRVLSLMRLNKPQSLTKGILSFLFYTCLVLTLQSVHLYFKGVQFNGLLIWILSAISLVLWIVSGSKISLVRANKAPEPTKNPVPTP